MRFRFAARRRLIGPAFLVALALNNDLYTPRDAQRVPMPLPHTIAEAPGAPRVESESWGAAPVPAAVAPKRGAGPLVLAREPDAAARRDAIEKRLRAAGAHTPAFVRLRALAELATPLAKIRAALEAARRKDDLAQMRRLLESALAGAEPDDLVTRDRVLRQLAAALVKLGQLDAARARMKEAADAVRRAAEIEIAELEQHKQALEAAKKMGRDLVAEKRALIARLAREPLRAPGEGADEDAKRMARTRAMIEEMMAKAPPDDAALREALKAAGR